MKCFTLIQVPRSLLLTFTHTKGMSKIMYMPNNGLAIESKIDLVGMR